MIDLTTRRLWVVGSRVWPLYIHEIHQRSPLTGEGGGAKAVLDIVIGGQTCGAPTGCSLTLITAVSCHFHRRPLTAEAQVRSKILPCGSFGEQCGIVSFIPKYFNFPVNIFPPMVQTCVSFIYNRCCTILAINSVVTKSIKLNFVQLDKQGVLIVF